MAAGRFVRRILDIELHLSVLSVVSMFRPLRLTAYVNRLQTSRHSAKSLRQRVSLAEVLEWDGETGHPPPDSVKPSVSSGYGFAYSMSGGVISLASQQHSPSKASAFSFSQLKHCFFIH